MKVALDVSPSGEVTKRGDVEAPADLHVLGALHVYDDDGAVRVYAVRDGAVWLVGKASLRAGAIQATTGEAPWAVVSAALEVPIHGAHRTPEPRAPEQVPGTATFVTFDVDREGVPSNIVTEREAALRTHAQGNMQVCVVGNRVTVYANGTCLGRAGRNGKRLVPTEAGYVSWARIERSLIAARVGRAKRAAGPWTPRKTKYAVFVAVLYGVLITSLVVGVGRDGRIDPLSLVIAIGVMAVAPLLLMWGIWILSSPEALSEPTTRDPHDHSKVNGPIASKGLLLTTFGSIVYGIVAITGGISAFGSRPEPAPAVVHDAAATTPPKPTPPPTPTTPTPTTPTESMEPATLAAAVAAATDDWAVARYAAHLALDDVKLATPETTIPLALKDGERERGKRTCATGAVGDIERTTLDKRDVYARADDDRR